MRKRHKKIYYRPGLISLIVVPLLLYYFANRQLRAARKTVLEVHWYNKAYWDTMTNKYSVHFVIPQRNVLELKLKGNAREDEIKLTLGEQYIRKIIASHDTVHAVNFLLGNGCKYSTLVRLLDMCNINAVDFFVASDEGVLMYYEYPIKFKHENNPPMRCL